MSSCSLLQASNSQMSITYKTITQNDTEDRDRGPDDEFLRRVEGIENGLARPDLLPGAQESHWTDSLPQILACCAAHSIVVHAGANMAFSAVLLPQLSKSNFDISLDEGSWIASLVAIATPVGSLLAGPLMDRWGRLTMCRLTCLPLLVSWVVMATADTAAVLCAGRALAGFGAGLSTVALVYVSEVSHPELRPMLLCLNSVFVSFGILLTCVMGLGLPWRAMAICFACLAGCSLLMMTPLPHSPHWLATFRKHHDGMVAALRWLNKREHMFQRELERFSIRNHISPEEGSHTDARPSFRDTIQEYMKPSTAKPLSILIFLFVFQQLSGAYVIIFYAVDIFQKIGGKFGAGINEYGALVMLGMIRFVMSILASGVSRRFGRRPLCITSGLGMCIAAFTVATYLIVHPASSESANWLPLLAVLCYVCFSAVGFLVIPWTLVGELLPGRVRGTGNGLMVALAYLFMFGVVKSFPYCMDLIGVMGVFFFFSITSLTCVAFVYIFLPETLGRTFEEIEQYFE